MDFKGATHERETVSDRNPSRKRYARPGLTRFGDVRALTAAASDPTTMEGVTNDVCQSSGSNIRFGPCTMG